VLSNLERVLAAVAGLLLFTLNELRLFNGAPRAAGDNAVHATWLRVFGDGAEVYLSTFDLATRWSLASLVVALSIWAVAQSLRPEPSPQ
jgi:hypothetical protein